MSDDAVGPYQLLDRIAVGGMAEVFLARRDERSPLVVVKRMLPQLARSPESVAMFLDEGKLGAMLHHPGIVEVLEVGQAHGECYLALEYVDGPDLSFVLEQGRAAGTPLPIELAVWIAARAADALHAAHRARHEETGDKLRLVHRDVSPHNLLVSRQGAVKVTDFGVAKSELQLSRTATGMIKGKIAYMAPEQIRADPVDARTDVFALGVTLYEALCGRRPFVGANEIEVIQLVLAGQVPPPSSVAPGVDLALEDILLRMLAASPDERVVSARHAAQALDGWLARRAPLVTQDTLARWMQQHVSQPEGDGLPWGWVFAGAPAALPDPEERRTALARPPVTQRRRPLRRLGAPPAPLPIPPPRRELVLYVEDDPRNYEVARLRLGRSYEVLHAVDDVTACGLIREHGDALCAILMDIELTRSALNGVELVRRLRGRAVGEASPPYAENLPVLRTPIFYVTAHADSFPPGALSASGADRVVHKPVDFAELTLALTSVHLARLGH